MLIRKQRVLVGGDPQRVAIDGVTAHVVEWRRDLLHDLSRPGLDLGERDRVEVQHPEVAVGVDGLRGGVDLGAGDERDLMVVLRGDDGHARRCGGLRSRFSPAPTEDGGEQDGEQRHHNGHGDPGHHGASREPPPPLPDAHRQRMLPGLDAECHGGRPGQVPGGLEAVLRFLGHGRRQDGVDAGGQVGAFRFEGRWRLDQVRIHERGVRLPAEWGEAGQALIEDASQGVRVGAGVEGLGLELLRRGVVQRADELARARQPGIGGSPPGQPEVREVGVANVPRSIRTGQEDVRRLHVAMHQPPGVRGVEARGDLTPHGDGVERLLPAEFVDERPQVGSLDVPHGDEQPAVVLARFVDRDDVGVVDGRGQPRLADEPFSESLVRGQMRRRSFRATFRASPRCSARYTTLIPPRPSSEMIRYPANVAPGESSTAATAPSSANPASLAPVLRPENRDRQSVR
jgi:hypothetical protein